jgi:hypothetical protein
MRGTDLLSLVAGLAWILALALIAAERRIVRRLRRAGALTPENAIPIAPRSALTRFRLGRLLRSGAVVTAPGGLYYLDPAAFALYRGRRRRRAFILISSALAIGAIFWVLRGR